MMNSGTKKYTIVGIPDVMTTTVKTIRGKFCIKLLVTHGRECSKHSMSFENLFTILPTGVFSKKLNGALITPANVFWWIFLADVTMMNITESSPSTFKRAAKKQERGQKTIYLVSGPEYGTRTVYLLSIRPMSPNPLILYPCEMTWVLELRSVLLSEMSASHSLSQ